MSTDTIVVLIVVAGGGKESRSFKRLIRSLRVTIHRAMMNA